MYLSAALLLLVISYLAFNSPAINYQLENKAAEEEAAAQQAELSKINERNTKLKEWTWFPFSDVDVDSEKYPIVILKSGFKVLKISDSFSLVGWKMDIVNTSIKSRYLPKVTYSITDSDGFHIGSSKQSGNISAQSFGVVQGTLEISSSDLERLSRDNWTISIGSWSTNEQDAKGKRYERLKAIVRDENKRPSWLKNYVDENSFMPYLSEKWWIIKAVVSPEPLKNDNEKKVNKVSNQTP